MSDGRSSSTCFARLCVRISPSFDCIQWSISLTIESVARRRRYIQIRNKSRKTTIGATIIAISVSIRLEAFAEAADVAPVFPDGDGALVVGTVVVVPETTTDTGDIVKDVLGLADDGTLLGLFEGVIVGLLEGFLVGLRLGVVGFCDRITVGVPPSAVGADVIIVVVVEDSVVG